MINRRGMRFILIIGGLAWLAAGPIKLAAKRHAVEDEPGSLGAKLGAAVSL